ncbi:lantibiotic dehydratase [Glycomyces tenuis]|uniref:lantibiotic dehydratase n=1 Tax=Glycomyces tenuis TaxID=58116 RepID=UPI0004116380|nr:lantibiotic dehydratase [Glycomyces tenuis]
MPGTYTFSGFAYARASTLERPWPRPAFDFNDHDAILARAGVRWLQQLWDRDDIRQVLTVASADLAERIEEILNGTQSQPKRLRSLLGSIYAYLARWERRSTPFGLFAGVAPARIGTETKTRLGTDHTAYRLPDAAALHTRAARYETDPDELAGLSICVNDFAQVRGDRLTIPSPASETHLSNGTVAEASVRASAPVLAAIELAGEPIGFDDLASRLHERFPGTALGRCRALVVQMVQAGALVTSARPAMTTLGTAASKTTAISELPTGDGAVHLGLDAEFCLPASVVAEAESAAETLLRLSVHPYGTPPWRDYLQRFLERYGPGAMVPVRDLVSDAGLGYPTGYLGAACAKGPRELTDRDAVAIELIQAAQTDGAGEIAITEQVTQRLQVGDGTDRVPPPRVELMFRLDAAGPAAIDRGQFRLWLTGIPRPESSLAGRFAPFLGPAETDRLAASFPETPERIVAQLSFPPRRARNGNVAAVPPLLTHLIVLGEHPPPGRAGLIGLDELAVTADPTQLHLIHTTTGRVVEAHALHALDATVHTPPLARFLAEVSGAGRTWWGPLDLGIARTLPYLPRLRSGRTVLAPARWLLDAADFPSPKAPAHQWDAEFDAWRQRWRMPDSVEFTVGDSRLPLDLRDRLDRHLLRTHLAGAGKLEVAEHEPRPSWIGRACEFALALHTVELPPAPLRRPVPAAALELPADRLVAATVHAHPRRIDQILTGHLPELLDAVTPSTEARWFTRFHDHARPDSEHLLQIRLRAVDEPAARDIATALRDWAARLHRKGLVADLDLTGYRHHAGRWGDDPAIAELVFTTDSAAALAELAVDETAPIEAFTAASAVDLAAALAPTSSEGWQWLTRVFPHEEVRTDRRIRKAAFSIVDRHGGDRGVIEAWAARRKALDAYRQSLTSDRDAQDVLRSLVHDLVTRRLGVDPDRERAMNRTIRATATRNIHIGAQS